MVKKPRLMILVLAVIFLALIVGFVSLQPQAQTTPEETPPTGTQPSPEETTTPETPANVLFLDDFEAGAQDWDLGDGWSLERINNNTVLDGTGHNWANLRDRTWENYAFKFKFKLIQGTIHINYRCTERTDGFYRYFIRITSNGLGLSKQIGDEFYYPVSLDLRVDDSWHEIEIRGNGNAINIYLDGGLHLLYDDEDPVFSGGISFETLDDSECLIDGVSITKTLPADVITGSRQASTDTENMVLIPAGSFLMGREDREGWTPMAAPEIFNDELPPHEVYVDAFYIDKYEVTNRQFMEFVNATNYVTDAERHGSSMVVVPIDQTDDPLLGTDIGFKLVDGATWRTPEGPGSSIENLMDYPVVQVSWNDASAYAKWVGKRLPTEAEWEKAARGGSNTNWFWSDHLDQAGRYQNIYGEHRLDYTYPPEVYDGYDETAPVGSLQPNGYGLYDTAGNVFEWVQDWYQYDYFSNSPQGNPTGPENGEFKVTKGGGWYLCECYTRPANREGGSVSDHNQGLGFRLALDAE